MHFAIFTKNSPHVLRCHIYVSMPSPFLEILGKPIFHCIWKDSAALYCDFCILREFVHTYNGLIIHLST